LGQNFLVQQSEGLKHGVRVRYAAVRLLELRFRISPGQGYLFLENDVSCTGTGLWGGSNPCPNETYRLCVTTCN